VPPVKLLLGLLGAVVLAVGVAGLADLGPFGDGDGARAPAVHAVHAVPAARFLDSVGVNTHLYFGDTRYADFAMVRARLRELGVRWIRDGTCSLCPGYDDHLVELAQDGIRAQLIFGDPTEGEPWIDRELASIEQRLLPAVGALEGPNEYDGSPDPAWAASLRAWQQQLYFRVKATPVLRALPIVGPSLVKPESRAALGDLSGAMDVGNLHPYTGGLMPAAAFLDGERRLSAPTTRSKPLMATEAGFHTALRMAPGANQPPVDETTQADYLTRLFLEHFAWGLRRTFSYELLDNKPDPGDGEAELHFGLLRSDFTPKPSFVALRNLLAVLRLGGAQGTADRLRLGLAGGGDVRHLLLAQADGSFSLALWRDVSSWDRDARRPITVAPSTVTIRLGEAMDRAETIVPARSTTPTATVADPQTLRVPLRATPVVLRLVP
jgi:hypothetical protein